MGLLDACTITLCRLFKIYQFLKLRAASLQVYHVKQPPHLKLVSTQFILGVHSSTAILPRMTTRSGCSYFCPLCLIMFPHSPRFCHILRHAHLVNVFSETSNKLQFTDRLFHEKHLKYTHLNHYHSVSLFCYYYICFFG